MSFFLEKKARDFRRVDRRWEIFQKSGIKKSDSPSPDTFVGVPAVVNRGLTSQNRLKIFINRKPLYCHIYDQSSMFLLSKFKLL